MKSIHWLQDKNESHQIKHQLTSLNDITMPNHRFLQELTLLEQNPMPGDFNLLVIGTFNAANQEGLNNDAEWFYGRYKNEFWYLFPQMLGSQSLHRREHADVDIQTLAERWRTFCSEQKVVVIDIYKSIEGILPNHGDDAIANHEDYDPFNYQRAFENSHFNKVIFTWKGRTNNTVLGGIKEEAHSWFHNRGSTVLHLCSPSYAYRRSKEFKLACWQNAYNDL